MQQINVTLGTAGHIDHGKTALVKCLTGCETDRLKEEKERGMSIELGFAPCRIADMQVGIVDVPGHENFIKTMVAGASGMDAVILVVAADDGVMPQTREHLDILTLLGVRQGIVALDEDRSHRRGRARRRRGRGCPLPARNIFGRRSDPARLERDRRGIRPFPGIALGPGARHTAEARRRRLSTTAGSGILGARLRHGDRRHPGRRCRSRRRRSRPPAAEPFRADPPHRGLWPTERDSHGGPVRGDQRRPLGPSPDPPRRYADSAATSFSPQEWYVCSARLLPREKLRVKSGAEVRFHTGTSDVAAMFYPLKGNAMEGGTEGLIQVRTKTPVVAGPGDPFILRTSSPVRTIGGGRIVEATDRRHKGSRPEVFADLQQRAEAVRDERRFVEYCIRRAESLAADEPAIVMRTKIPAGRVQEILADLLGRALVVALPAKLYMHRDTLAEAVERFVDEVRDFHRQSPENLGLPVERLRQSSGIERDVFDGLLADALRAGRLVERNQCLALLDHRTTFQDEDAKWLEAIEGAIRKAGFAPPAVDEVARQAGCALEKTRKLLGLLRSAACSCKPRRGCGSIVRPSIGRTRY